MIQKIESQLGKTTLNGSAVQISANGEIAALNVVTTTFESAGTDNLWSTDANWSTGTPTANTKVVYEIWLGGAAKLAASAGGAVQAAHKTLCWFVLVGWAIYPIGYMAGTEGWYSGIFGGLPMDVIYNVGDAINKIGFGLVVYNLAVNSK